MNFWQAQRKARARTALYLVIFFILSAAVAGGVEFCLRFFAKEGYTPPMPYTGFVFFGVTCAVAAIYYAIYRRVGGAFVAESLGGKKISADSPNFQEAQLYNIVQEMAVASGKPIPSVYVVKAQEINAFAAGVTPDKAAIAVTTGALRELTREELQGVIAHEFGHIVNADMRLNMRLAALIMGLVFVLYMGIRLLEGSLLFGDRKRGNNPVALIALVFLVAGSVMWIAGAILRSFVSRQREYLADASAVQYTRNPDGLVQALRKIKAKQEVRDMPRRGMAYSHLYFDNHSYWATLFATHPPLEKRIAALKGTPL